MAHRSPRVLLHVLRETIIHWSDMTQHVAVNDIPISTLRTVVGKFMGVQRLSATSLAKSNGAKVNNVASPPVQVVSATMPTDPAINNASQPTQTVQSVSDADINDMVPPPTQAVQPAHDVEVKEVVSPSTQAVRAADDAEANNALSPPTQALQLANEIPPKADQQK